ncbi:hypothetical protein HMPREF0548_1682 [Lactobacillus ultunensis DSM 16047]|uniref:Uncharacterized protein n=1 Tax=Lactobacillus ultunensis DSM 16047 TaxID=525365 RepID=C2EPT6_9LACO|nr:hypothetical protein HMPREF0548_1682 [Lactobacillus ultunensis DSM 16047]
MTIGHVVKEGCFKGNFFFLFSCKLMFELVLFFSTKEKKDGKKKT